MFCRFLHFLGQFDGEAFGHLNEEGRTICQAAETSLVRGQFRDDSVVLDDSRLVHVDVRKPVGEVVVLRVVLEVYCLGDGFGDDVLDAVGEGVEVVTDESSGTKKRVDGGP